MAQEPELATITVGREHPVTISLWKSDLEKMHTIFPQPNFQRRNKHHPAIVTLAPEGIRTDLYLRRIIADLMLRERGVLCAKGFSVETRDGNPLNLPRSNLKIVPTKERVAMGKQPRRNGWLTHYILGVRLKALAEGRCPDEAMEAIAFEWLRKNAANDNGPGDQEKSA